MYHTAADDDHGAAWLYWLLHLLVGTCSRLLGTYVAYLFGRDSGVQLRRAELGRLDLCADVDALRRADDHDDGFADDDDRGRLRSLLHDHDDEYQYDDDALRGLLQVAMVDDLGGLVDRLEPLRELLPMFGAGVFGLG